MTKLFQILTYLLITTVLSGCGAAIPITLQFDYESSGSPKSLNGQSIQVGEFSNNLGFSDSTQVKSNLKYTQPISQIVKSAIKQELVAAGYQVSQSNLELSGAINKMWGQNEINFNITDTDSNTVVLEKTFRTNIHHDMLWDTASHQNNLRELIDLFLSDQEVQKALQAANSYSNHSSQQAITRTKPPLKQQNTKPHSTVSYPTNDRYTNRKKVALVIGNSAYKIGPLKNPKNDASDIAEALKNLNFTVILEINANQQKMDNAIALFGRTLTDNSVGLFYYAGHGVQVGGRNYLIPVNAGIRQEHDVKYKALDLGVVLDEMRHAQTGLNIILLDACRDNPLPKSSRSSSRGLARVPSPTGTIIVYSTSPGSTAADGTGRNGLFSKHLLEYISKPNLSIEKVMKNVSKQVQLESKNKQIPWMESSFTGDFYFSKK